MKAIFDAEHTRLCELAGRIIPDWKPPKLLWNEVGNVAGRAVYGPNEVRLNLVYAITQGRDMLEDTLPHEIAHIMAYQLFGREVAGHGKEWKECYRMLTKGKDPTRCHTYGRAKDNEAAINAVAQALLDKLNRE